MAQKYHTTCTAAEEAGLIARDRSARQGAFHDPPVQPLPPDSCTPPKAGSSALEPSRPRDTVPSDVDASNKGRDDKCILAGGGGDTYLGRRRPSGPRGKGTGGVGGREYTSELML